MGFFHTANLTGAEFNIYAVGMKRGFREDALHNSFGELAGGLMVLLYNRHVLPRSDVLSVLPVHTKSISGLDSCVFSP